MTAVTVSQKFLVIAPAWVGDMVMAQTLFIYLKILHPNCQIDVVAPKSTLPLLEHMPQVTQRFLLPLGHGAFSFLARWQFGEKLQSERYTQAFVLPNSWKSAIIPKAAKIPFRTGWRGEMRYGLLNDIRILNKSQYPLMIERFMALACSANTGLAHTLVKTIRPHLLISPETRENTVQQFAFLFDPEKPFLVFCPGAEYGPAKRWPTRHFATLAKFLSVQGFTICLIGSPKEQPLALEIQRESSEICIDLTGQTNLTEAIALISMATAVITNDSGLMHIAAATQRPLVALYGSSSPMFTPPLHDEVAILSLNLDCSPCFARKCPLKHTKCLEELSPEHVFNILISQLKSTDHASTIN